jgi:Rrf2 family protein
MMRLSTRGRYALRAMADIALHDGNGPVARQDIADRQELSAAYVAQLFARLRSAGLVEGVKGPGGGYCLARDPAMITASDVLQAVEGPLTVVPCTLDCPDTQPVCSRVDECVTHILWKRLSATIAEQLESVTLQDLCDEAQRLSSRDGRMQRTEPAAVSSAASSPGEPAEKLARG